MWQYCTGGFLILTHIIFYDCTTGMDETHLLSAGTLQPPTVAGRLKETVEHKKLMPLFVPSEKVSPAT